MGYEHTFQPFTYSIRSFSKGRGRGTPPQAIHRFRPPSFIGLMLELIQTLRLIANKLYKKTNKIKLFIFPCSYFRISRATAKQFDKNIPCLLVDCRILPACVALKKYDRLFNIIYRFQFAILQRPKEGFCYFFRIMM